MSVKMELDFGKYCIIDGSPTTVLPAPRHLSKLANVKSRGNTKCVDKESNLDEDLIKINFSQSRRVQSRDARPERISKDSDGRIKRGSVYQSSREVRQQQQTDAVIGRKKVEFTGANVSALYLDVIDSVCSSSDEESSRMEEQEQRLLLMSRKCQYQEKETCSAVPQCSPTHLHGLLKLGSKHGEPFFEFSVDSPEDVYVANRWKMDNALTWVYTFHRQRKSNTGPSVFKNRKEPSILGEMKVSCCLRTEYEGAGDMNDSLLTEFVLYDTPHTRKGLPEYSASCLPNTVNALHVSHEISARTKTRSQPKHSHDSYSFEAASEVACSEQEILAAVIQLPLEKRESLKLRSGDKKIIEVTPNAISSTGEMTVAIPAGRHSLPTDGTCSPSPVLDRFRSGGGCDCGGWDMACPLTIFSTPDFELSESQSLMRRQHPIGLNFQGRKDNIPAFSMRYVKDGKYEVDFHALLSSLQAFSISVAILHAANASTRRLAEEQIRHINCAVAEEEKYGNPNKMEAPVAPSFVIVPPFSRIARI